jgi:hypothetical protein
VSDSKWYTAIMVMTSEIDGAVGEDPLVDLQFRILQASDAESAYACAMEVGQANESSYANDDGEMVKWVLAGLHELIELDNAPGHGVEIYSRLTRDAPASLIPPRESLQVFAIEKFAHLSAEEMLDRVEGTGQ